MKLETNYSILDVVPQENKYDVLISETMKETMYASQTIMIVSFIIGLILGIILTMLYFKIKEVKKL